MSLQNSNMVCYGNNTLRKGGVGRMNNKLFDQNLMMNVMMVQTSGIAYAGAIHATGLSIFAHSEYTHAERFLPKP